MDEKELNILEEKLNNLELDISKKIAKELKLSIEVYYQDTFIGCYSSIKDFICDFIFTKEDFKQSLKDLAEEGEDISSYSYEEEIKCYLRAIYNWKDISGKLRYYDYTFKEKGDSNYD